MSVTVSSLPLSHGAFTLRPPTQRTGPQNMPHPKTGQRGVWVPFGLWENMELAYEDHPKLLEETRLLRIQVEETAHALTLMTETASSAQGRARVWERRYDLIFDENLALRFKLNEAGDPWWARVLTLTLGAVLAYGSIELAQRAFIDR